MTAPEAHRQYDQDIAANYDRDREGEQLWRLEDAFVRDYLAAMSPATLLDAPVGTARFLSSYPPDCVVVGVDASEEMLTQARHKIAAAGRTGVSIETGDIFALHFGDRRFDVTLCWRFLHLIPVDLLGPALSELARVTSGQLLVQAYVQAGSARRLAARLKRLPKLLLTRLLGRQATPWAHIPAHFHSRAQFDAAFSRAGLRLERETLLCPYEGYDVLIFQLHAPD